MLKIILTKLSGDVLTISCLKSHSCDVTLGTVGKP